MAFSHFIFLEFQLLQMCTTNSITSTISSTAISRPTIIPPISPLLIPPTVGTVLVVPVLTVVTVWGVGLVWGVVTVWGVVLVWGVVTVWEVVTVWGVVTVCGVVLVWRVVPGGRQSGALRLSRNTGQDGSASSRETPTLIDAVPVPTHACSSCTSPPAL